MNDFLVGLVIVTYVGWYIVNRVRKNMPPAARSWAAPRRASVVRSSRREERRMEQPEKAVAEAPAATSGDGKVRPFVVYKGEPREVLKRNSLGDAVQCVLRPDTAGGCRPCVVVPRDQILWLPK
jgi:hypothetical protein